MLKKIKPLIIIAALFVGFIFLVLGLSDALNTPIKVILVVIYAFVLFYLKNKEDRKQEILRNFPYQKVIYNREKYNLSSPDTLDLENKIIKIKGDNLNLLKIRFNDISNNYEDSMYKDLTRQAIEYIENNYKVVLPVSLPNHPNHDLTKRIYNKTINENFMDGEPFIVQNDQIGKFLEEYSEDLYDCKIQYYVFNQKYDYIYQYKHFNFYSIEIKELLRSIDHYWFTYSDKSMLETLPVTLQIKEDARKLSTEVLVVLKNQVIGTLSSKTSKPVYYAIKQGLNVESRLCNFTSENRMHEQILIYLKVNHDEV